MRSKVQGKLWFTGVTVVACLASDGFRASLAAQVALPLVLLAVWFDRRLLAALGFARGEASNRPKPPDQDTP